ncbi:MAG TPA: hypothetical protein PK370_01120 [Candidatus Woesebacteria bacterium]|nr:hypothetical protein [Candidatus Woesebacteria bacterium]HPJ17482.1 hypothetical protein [Candidatus Woesebacteria bacterium]
MYQLIAFILTSLLLLLSPQASFAQGKPWSDKCVGAGNLSDVPTIQGFECLFGNLLNVVMIFAGLAFFIMFIVGGFNYLLSSGDDKKTAAAAATITSSVIGIVGVILSFFIIKLIQTFVGADINITDFLIPGP